MEQKNGHESKDSRLEGDTALSKAKEHHAPAAEDAQRAPKKRRKVNHACVYCRRSHMTCDLERPCTRCIKRNIGHLCHDEPREHETKKAKSGLSAQSGDDSEPHVELPPASMDSGPNTMRPPSYDGTLGKAAFDAGVMGRSTPMLVPPTSATGLQTNALNSNMNQFAGFQDAWLTAQNHFNDMQNYHPNNYMIAPEVTNEFNLLNDFLHSSLLDDGAQLQDDQNQLLPGGQGDVVSGLLGNNDAGGDSLLPPSAMPPPPNNEGKSIQRPASALPVDKAREYYLQAADPSGNDTPEERMQRVLQAKYDAGLLKPFNYVKGYQRLQTYLESHIAQASKQKILRQIDRIRPKFREKMKPLTTMDLMFVEMWFEKTLMEYNRVFASMAVPACCWRRTGEIFRGNKEMAELIDVPVERLRDGQIALHEILTEESVVRYWEEFGTIAFDPAHDTLLTACTLKSPDDNAKEPILLNCCFSFMIRRDDHKIPSLIVGNFLPHDPKP